MEIKINIQKKHLFVFSILVSALIVSFLVVAYGTNNPQTFGHSVGELNWNDEIQGDVKLSGSVIVNQQEALTSNANYISVGDIITDDGARGLKLRAGDTDRVTIEQTGDIVFNTQGAFNINQGNLNLLNGNLNVNNGDIQAKGKIYNSNDCIDITPSPVLTPQAIPVPDECMDNECLILVKYSGLGCVGSYRFTTYKQSDYAISGLFNRGVWRSDSLSGKLNGENDDMILVFGGSWGIWDDWSGVGGETNKDQWYWYPNGCAQALYVCK